MIYDLLDGSVDRQFLLLRNNFGHSLLRVSVDCLQARFIGTRCSLCSIHRLISVTSDISVTRPQSSMNSSFTLRSHQHCSFSFISVDRLIWRTFYAQLRVRGVFHFSKGSIRQECAKYYKFIFTR